MDQDRVGIPKGARVCTEIEAGRGAGWFFYSGAPFVVVAGKLVWMLLG